MRIRLDLDSETEEALATRASAEYRTVRLQALVELRGALGLPRTRQEPSQAVGGVPGAIQLGLEESNQAAAWEEAQHLNGFRVGDQVVTNDGQDGIIQGIDGLVLEVRLDNGIGKLVALGPGMVKHREEEAT